jgi:hypothetical protein
VRAKDDVVGDVERVGHLPRRMRRGVVQRVEVVVDKVDLRPVDHDVPEPDEDVEDVAPGLLDQVRVPAGVRGAGQGDVDAIRAQPLLQLTAAQLAGPLLDEALERPPRAVQLVAAGAALVRRKGGQLAQRLDERGLAPQRLDPDLLQRRGVGCTRDARRCVRDQSVHVHDGRVV